MEPRASAPPGPCSRKKHTGAVRVHALRVTTRERRKLAGAMNKRAPIRKGGKYNGSREAARLNVPTMASVGDHSAACFNEAWPATEEENNPSFVSSRFPL